MSGSFSLGSVQVKLPPAERFGQFLQRRGKRITQQRRLIVETVFSHHDHFDADELWAAVEARRVQAVAIVGDAFGKPMLRALEGRSGRRDLSCCFLIVSSGVMWSPEVKQGLLARLPQAILQDSFGSSEAVGFGLEITTRERTTRLGKFQIGPNCKVFTPEGEEVRPGSGVAGFVARSGPIPLGYYKDAEKTAKSFPVIGDTRYAIPGDRAAQTAEGSVRLLGRDSVTINTGGEKVFAEEVEQALKHHRGVYDALVVGTPSERWGQQVTALVRTREGAAPSEVELRQTLREHIAAYKLPKAFVFVEEIARSPSGKADYRWARRTALEKLGLRSG